MLTAREIRSRYLDFFARHQHKLVQSGPLIPPDDPTLLFTNAGMVQFKEFFWAKAQSPSAGQRPARNAFVFRASTMILKMWGALPGTILFFEMLGNFSFGDYFKREAITWAWEFVTEELKLPKDKLWVTIYRDDDEAAKIWNDVAGLPDDRIVRMGEKDNFWTMGETGPCGPCSEIYIDQGEDMACGPDCGIGKCDCDRFLEIWNLVFTQFDQLEDGKRQPLAQPNIDTGMGLERIAAVCQGKRSNFDCDLFQEIIQYAARLANVTYSASEPDSNDVDTALRVIADHSRAAAFLIAEGVLPSNEGRGYVLRRLIRRALRFATLMGVHEPFMHNVAYKVTEIMGDAYSELAEHAEFIRKAVYEEEKRFAQTLEKGLLLLEEELTRLKSLGQTEISGDFCFKLYDTYGFPLDIVTDVSEKRGFSVDGPGFAQKMAEQRDRARSHQKKMGLLGQGGGEALKNAAEELWKKGLKTKFVGYESLKAATGVLALLDACGNIVQSLGEGDEGYLLTADTPFYGESGGQAGDMGAARSATGKASIGGAIKPLPSMIFMKIKLDAGEINVGQEIELEVDEDIRKSVARNHTCAHLLHASLRRILGAHVKQAGSSVDGSRLRFDFSHLAALSQDELAAVERDVNRAIMADVPITACEMGREEAEKLGAMALFSEKYGDIVRVLTVGEPEQEPESVELCGGTHLSRTGQAGAFLIVSESAVAAGVRRIEAVTGWNAYNYAIGQRSELGQLARELKVKPSQLGERVLALRDELKKNRKSAQAAAQAEISVDQLAAGAEQIKGITVLAANLDKTSMKALRDIMDKLRSLYARKAVIFLAGEDNGKAALLLHVSKDLHEEYTAPKLIKPLAEICGGSGGGRPDLAQAGGTAPDKIPAALAKMKELI